MIHLHYVRLPSLNTLDIGITNASKERDMTNHNYFSNLGRAIFLWPVLRYSMHSHSPRISSLDYFSCSHWSTIYVVKNEIFILPLVEARQ